MKVPTSIIVLHWDMKGPIREQLKLPEILEFATKQNCILFDSPYVQTERLPVSDSIHLTGEYFGWNADVLSAFAGETVLLCGGYRSLCVRDAYRILVAYGIHVVVHPEWIVEDPSWYTPDSAMRAADGLSFLWEYPTEILFNPHSLSI